MLHQTTSGFSNSYKCVCDFKNMPTSTAGEYHLFFSGCEVEGVGDRKLACENWMSHFSLSFKPPTLKSFFL